MEMDEIRARGEIDAALRNGDWVRLRETINKISAHDYQLFARVTNNRSFGEYLVASSRSKHTMATANAFCWLLNISLPRLDVQELLDTLSRKNDSNPTVACAKQLTSAAYERRLEQF